MAEQLWQLRRFLDCLRRWVETSHPPDATVKAVTDWITDNLTRQPFVRGAKRWNEDPTMLYVQLPYRSTEGRYVLVAYQINTATRELTCIVLEEITDNSRP